MPQEEHLTDQLSIDMAIDKKTFTTGMNLDLAESMVPNSSYRYALNIRNANAQKGATGVIINAEGNREISFTLPSGGNTVIGAYDDEFNDRLIYIVHNTEGDNRILSYNYKLNEIVTIIADTGNVLDLDLNHLITGINVISGDDTSYLLFTDNYGEPKNIDIESGIRTYDDNYKKYFGDFDTVSPSYVNEGDVYYRNINITDTSGSSTTYKIYFKAKITTSQDPTVSVNNPNPLSDWEVCPAGYIYGEHNEESFLAIVKPPEIPITNYTTNSNKFNYLYGNFYQFKVKYVRADGRESSWSEISEYIDPAYIPDTHITSVGLLSNMKFNNEISILTNIPDVSIYKYIKIAVRKVNNNNAPEDWYLINKINIPTTYTNRVYTDRLQIAYAYDGTQALMPIDQSEAAQLMSWIPKKAKAQAITSKNRIVYSNFVEGMPYSLDGDYDINQNPPQIEFLERINPYVPATDLEIYYYDGSTVGSLVPSVPFYDPPVVSASGIAIKLPSTMRVGERITINASVELEVSGATEPIRGYGRSLSKISQTTNTTNFINNFVTEINSNENYFLYEYSNQIFNKRLLTASYFTSGGNEYLILQPTVYATSGSITITPQFSKSISAVYGGSTAPIRSFKRGTQQQFGISYSDDYGRLSSVIYHDNFKADCPWWKDITYSAYSIPIAGNDYDNIGQRYAKVYLNHDAPSWATKYHILKTNQNGLNNYISFPLAAAATTNTAKTALPRMADGTKSPLEDKFFFRGFLKNTYTDPYTDITVSADSYSGLELIYIPLTSLQSSPIAFSTEFNCPTVYDFISGDRLRVCYNINPTTENDYYEDIDVPILAYNNELNCIIIKVSDLPTSYTASATDLFGKDNESGDEIPEIGGLLCEIYNPIKTITNSFYYEMYTGTISADTANSRYYHVGNKQTQTSAQSAIIELDGGDCYIKPRSYKWLYAGVSISDTALTKTDTYYVEDANYYDKEGSKFYGFGRPNRTIKSTSLEEDITGFLGEAYRPTTFRYSEAFLPDQGYNGLGTIYDLNFTDANPSMGSIQYLHTEGSDLYVFQENAVGRAMGDRNVVTTLDGNNMSIAANTPISPVSYYGTRAGIGKNPESFAYNNYRKYFVDVDQGQVCRLSMDGVEPISLQRMDSYFKTVFTEMTNSSNPIAVGSYDKRTDEYVINLKWESEVIELTQSDVIYSGGYLTYIFENISQYYFYAGQFVRIVTAANPDGTPLLFGTDFYAEVTDIYSDSVRFFIPTAYRSEIDDLINNYSPFIGWYIKFYPTKSITLGYSERIKGWTSFYSWGGDYINTCGLSFASFQAGKLYMHDDFENPMKYYGNYYPSHIDMVSNVGGDQNKFWKTFGIKATAEDSIINLDDFEVASSRRDTVSSLIPRDSGVIDSRGAVTTCHAPVYKEGQIYFDYMRTNNPTNPVELITLTEQGDLSQSGSGASLTVQFDTNGYDIYVGQAIDITTPQYDYSMTTYLSKEFIGEVSAFDATSITFTIPLQYQTTVQYLPSGTITDSFALKFYIYKTIFYKFLEGDKLRGYWNITRLVIKPATSKIYKIISGIFDFHISNYTR